APPPATTGNAVVPVVAVPGLPYNPGFNVDISLPASGLTALQQQAVRDAVGYWSTIIVGDLPSDLTVDGLVDDLRIRFNVGALDGAGGRLAETTLLDVRTGSLRLPSLASITIDQADLAAWTPAQLQAVIRHEIAHAMGFGELWASLGLVNTATAGNPQFTGANATAAYAALTSSAQTGVPLDNRVGANATHWREVMFGNELMTPLLDVNGPYPLSALSLAALRDMGYTVSLAQADAYALPGGSFVFHPNATAPANTGSGELLDATGGGVTPSQVAAAPAPTATDHLFFAFDFGPGSSPTTPGYGGVTAATTYAVSRGWGWQAGSVITERSAPANSLAPLTGDLVQTSDGTFLVDLPDGTYDVIVTLGDDGAAHDNMTYEIEGVRRGAVSTLAGQHASVTHRVEVTDGQMTLRFGGNGVPVALNALEVHQISTYTTPATNFDYSSGHYYIAMQNLATGFVMRSDVDVTSGSPLCPDGVVLSPNAAYRQYVYHVESNTVAISEFVTPSSGVNFNLPQLVFGNRVSGDTDGDGLENLAEFIVGTRADRIDTDGDGLGDLVELQQHLSPTGGAAIPTGVIASQAANPRMWQWTWSASAPSWRAAAPVCRSSISPTGLRPRSLRPCHSTASCPTSKYVMAWPMCLRVASLPWWISIRETSGRRCRLREDRYRGSPLMAVHCLRWSTIRRCARTRLRAATFLWPGRSRCPLSGPACL
ncbi:MAG: hypothetical protein ABL982_16510, partial [Vicinamibacterales bacterium]